jgi:putative aldouronate transport system substrate-binding protein
MVLSQYQLKGVHMTKKRWLVSLVFLLLFLLVNVSCSQKDQKLINKPIPISMLFNNDKAFPFNPDWLIFKEYKKRKNVQFDITLGNNADYMKDLTTALQSSSPPDILLKIWPEPIQEYASRGILLPINEYEHLLPNFKKYLATNNYQDDLEKLRHDSGNYYILPGFQRKIQVQQWVYRKDVFEQNAIDIPQTYSEMLEALRLLKEKYPDSSPLSGAWGGAHLFAMMGAGYGIQAGWNGTRYYDYENKRWAYAPASENFKAMYGFLHACYEAGILDPAIFTQDENTFYTKMQEGKVFVATTWVTSGFSNWNAKLEENGFPNGEWAPLPVPQSTVGIRSLPAVDPYRKGLALSVKVKDKPYFKELLTFLDWALYSEEGRTLTTWGVEGITFETTEAGRQFIFEDPTLDFAKNILSLKKTYGLDLLFNLAENESFEDYKKPSEITEFLTESLARGDTADPLPSLILSDEYLKPISILNDKLDDFVQESSIKFITGDLDIDLYWTQYLSQLSDLGYKTLENIWNSP